MLKLSNQLNRLRPIFTNIKVVYILYAVLALIAAGLKFSKGSYNNYLIYKNVFYHTIDLKPLYELYPVEYFDSNHYGPFFSIIIAPFALLPDYIGAILWAIFTAVFLVFSFTKLPLKNAAIAAICWICVNEIFTSLVSFQFNPITTGLIVLSYTFVKDKKDIWATLCIVIGTLVKLYGIVGLVFFLFSDNKIKFIYSLMLWFAVLFAAPMLISSYDYILQSYQEWYLSLVEKNGLNATLTSFQDISVMGMFRRIVQDVSISNLPFLMAGLFLYGLPLLRVKMYKDVIFQQLILCSTLLFIVLFSSGSESPSYIIAFAGVAIWFCLHKPPINKVYIALFIFAFIFTSLGSTDLFPKFFRTFMRLYSLKAFPCLLVWLLVIYESLTMKLESKNCVIN